MMAIKGSVAVVMLAASFFSYADDFLETFSPSLGVVATVKIKGDSLVWRLSGDGGVKYGMVSFDTEKPLSIEVDSYDFSGRPGFRVSYMDDGKGVYSVDRIFTFFSSSYEFVERFPSCGDGFFNLVVDKNRRYLVSTYWSRNSPKKCFTRLSI
ncbi:hypothetical protein GJG85_20740 [Burkholderia sp. MS389]|uniref:hypothetical protein n=1 Tax=Burkholderia sp. MS389 TaxID=2811789 RepID=UPI00195BF503|nr:hypothetical protein [Burkholderia sp. MS389]QRR15828.1 hypothetical protein GJG85_20740 [Burkholderia sp. MS389]